MTLLRTLPLLLLVACAVAPAPLQRSAEERATPEKEEEQEPVPQPPKKDGGGTPQPPLESASDIVARYPGSRVALPSVTPAPALIMLHGSEGGRDGTTFEFAQEIAKHGYVVMTLCWFDCAGTPSVIQAVPLDRTVDAARALKSAREVAGKKLGLFGWSRGGEQAVLLASLVKQPEPFAAVLAHAPSDTVVCGFDPNSRDGSIYETHPQTGQRVFAAAWTWQGTKLFGELREPFGSGPRIAVEAYAGPMWISHGTRDQLWEVEKSQRIEQSRRQVPAYPTEAHYWQGEDHAVVTYSAQNQAAFYRVLVDFLKKHL
jgi:hypothetical protein